MVKLDFPAWFAANSDVEVNQSLGCEIISLIVSDRIAQSHPGAFLPTSSESQTSEEIANALERLAQKVRRRVKEKSPSTSESTNSELQEALVITKCK